MRFTDICNRIFSLAVGDYHITDDVDVVCSNPYEVGSLEHVLYKKAWIDTLQWHLEDLIRSPRIEPSAALEVKRRIDRSNQERTDIVEEIDTYFLEQYRDVVVLPDARLNTESPAWAIDRLSILHVKLWHMREQVERADASREHIERCRAKWQVLQEQFVDLTTSIDQLLADYSAGRRVMKVYRQMKMYNDPSLNPVLYKVTKGLSTKDQGKGLRD